MPKVLITANFEKPRNLPITFIQETVNPIEYAHMLRFVVFILPFLGDLINLFDHIGFMVNSQALEVGQYHTCPNDSEG